uniref:Uncharacterized protein n=1 Tax=Oryza glumipatula TaxID=40148 RepID=A0A0E0ALZ3_9ORYZ
MSVVELGTSAMVLPYLRDVCGAGGGKGRPLCSAGGRRGSLLTRQKEMRYDVRRIEPTESLKDTAARGAKPRPAPLDWAIAFACCNAHIFF